MKRTIALLLTALLLLSLTACGGSSPTDTPAQRETEETTPSQDVVSENETEAAEAGTEAEPEAAAEENVEAPVAEPETAPEGEKVLVVYFSATGTTKDVAEKIAALTGADLYEIKAAQEYTEDDLNWNDSDSRTTHEQNDSSARPEIGSDPVSLDGYSTVYIGYPIWWGEEPRIMDTFVESYDFNGITMIPFCTSGGSGMGRSGKNLADNAGSGNWLDGQRFGAGASESEIQSWLDGLG